MPRLISRLSTFASKATLFVRVVAPRLPSQMNRKVERLDSSRWWGSVIKHLNEFDEEHKGTPKKILKWLRAFLKLTLFLLAPTFFLLYGWEILSLADTRSRLSSDDVPYYRVAGWTLITLCCLLSGLMIVAFFSREPDGKEEEIDGNRGKAWIGAVLYSVDVIAIGIIPVLVLLTPAHEFRPPPLRYVQNKINHWIHEPTVASIIGVTNNANETFEFTVRHNERTVSVLAIGEEAIFWREGYAGEDSKVEWVDYGWIEDENKNHVWEMKHGNIVDLGDKYPLTYKVIDTLELKPGRYVLRYTSDGSYSVNLCKVKPEPDSPLKIVTLSSQDKKDNPLPAFSTCLKIRATVEREPSLLSFLIRTAYDFLIRFPF